MNTIKPFRGLYYTDKSTKSNNLSRVVCPPYDMISSEKKDELKSKNEFNAVNLVSPNSYEEAKKALNEWIKNDILTFDETQSIYIYEISYRLNNEVYRLKAMVAKLKLPEDGENYVITHKKTNDEHEIDRIKLLDTTKCQFSPICVLYNDNENKIKHMLRTISKSNYLFKSKQNNIIHKIWRINDPNTISIFEELFDNKTYCMVDGHNRFKAACAYRNNLRKNENISDDHPANFIMTCFIEQNDQALTILPTHRIVSNIDMFDSDDMLKKSSQYFNIIKCKTLKSTRKTMFGLRTENKNAFGLYADGAYYVLILKDKDIMKKISKHSNLYNNLDVTVLHELFFKNLLNIKSDNIAYTQSANKACQYVDNGDACFSVFLSATRLNELMDISKSEENMPPKSTVFFPNPVSGLIFYALD